MRDPGVVLDFATKALWAAVTERIEGPDGSLMHAELRIGDSIVMISGAPPGAAPMPAMLSLYLPDVDAVHRFAGRNETLSLDEIARRAADACR